MMDGHRSHTTKEFLTRCEELGIVPFPFIPHTTHFAQPLDDKSFLAYKQKYKALNNSINRYGCTTSDQGDFLRDFFRDIASVRKEAFTSGTIRSSFRKCGIWPFNPSVVLEPLQAKEIPIPDIQVFGDDPRWSDEPRPRTPPISSPVDSSMTPRTIQRSTDNLSQTLTTDDIDLVAVQRRVNRVATKLDAAAKIIGELQRDLALATAIKERREQPRSKR